MAYEQTQNQSRDALQQSGFDAATVNNLLNQLTQAGVFEGGTATFSSVGSGTADAGSDIVVIDNPTGVITTNLGARVVDGLNETANITINTAGSNDKFVATGSGNDTITDTGGGDDFVFSGAGNDTITGAAGDDTLVGGGGNDLIGGGEGADLLSGENGDDYLVGDAGDDTILGGDGSDTVYGGDGADVIFGGGGNDTLVSGAGDDFVAGQDGDDIIVVGSQAGGGDDTIDGGSGSDQVAFTGVAISDATITSANGVVTVVIGNDTYTISSVETLVFTDGTIDTESL